MTKTSANFEEWWKWYPRKQSKGDGWKAWRQVDGDEIADEIIKATKVYPFSDEPKYIKLPATFLRAWCWTDQFDTEDSNDSNW